MKGVVLAGRAGIAAESVDESDEQAPVTGL